MKHNQSMRDAFSYFRKAWSPRASYHLARMRYDPDWRARLVSGIWLACESVPLSGAAPSMGFSGLPYRRN